MDTPIWKGCGHPKTPETTTTTLRCRICKRADDRKRINPVTNRVRALSWNKRHPEVVIARQRRWFKKRYQKDPAFRAAILAYSLAKYHRRARTDENFLIEQAAKKRARYAGDLYVPDNRPPGPGLIKALHTIDLR